MDLSEKEQLKKRIVELEQEKESYREMNERQFKIIEQAKNKINNEVPTLNCKENILSVSGVMECGKHYLGQYDELLFESTLPAPNTYHNLKWIDEPDTFKTHMEKLKAKGIIYFKHIETVMSGREWPIFIKREKNERTYVDVLGLFQFWEKYDFIEKVPHGNNRIKKTFRIGNEKEYKEFDVKQLRSIKYQYNGDDSKVEYFKILLL